MVAIKSTIRNAPWVVIAVVLHVIIIVVLSIVYVQHANQAKEVKVTTVTINTDKPVEILDAPPEVAPIVDRKAIPKIPNKDVEIVDPDRDVGMDVPIPTGPEDLSKEVGDPSAGPDQGGAPPAGGGSIGVGKGGGGPGTGRPSAFGPRGDKSKEGTGGLNGRAGGPTAPTEKAVRDGLIWLIRHQQKDGSWSAARMAEVCDAKGGGCCGESKGSEFTATYDEGLTGLSLIAFLGFGADHTNQAKMVDTVRAKKTRLGEVVKNGLQWLKKRQAEHTDGRFSKDGEIYNEALATLAMSEAYGMTGHVAWKESAQKGVDFLVAAQRVSPTGTGLWGWRYEPRAWIEGPEGRAAVPDEKEWKAKIHESDISATAWVVMALKSAELSGLSVPEASMKGAMDFVKYVTTKEGRVAYMDPLQVGRKIPGDGDHFAFHETTLAALGMCCRTFIEKNIDDPILDLSAARVMKDLPVVSKDKLSVDYYYWYYATLALYQFDGPDSPRRTGKYWNLWNRSLAEVVTGLQEESDTCGRGGWPTPDRWSLSGGPIYRTAINVLTLEVYYRYENAFGAALNKKKDDKDKLDKAGGGDKK